MTNQMSDIITQLAVAMPMMLTILGAVAFMVTIIVQMTKELKYIKPIPTKTWTLVISIVTCTVLYFILAGIASFPITWYYIMCVIIAGFPVSYISTYGWDTFNQLWKRFNNKGGK